MEATLIGISIFALFAIAAVVGLLAWLIQRTDGPGEPDRPEPSRAVEFERNIPGGKQGS